MQTRQSIRKISWTFIDQGVVSFGAFFANILLARHLPPSEYGVFALIFGMLLGLQIINGSLLFYPLSIRVAVAVEETKLRLIHFTLLLAALTSFALGGVLCLALISFERPDLALPTLAWFLSWQIQEATRRALFAEFRHRGAVIGDSISYIGQVFLIGCLALMNDLTLSHSLYAMAFTSTLAAFVQGRQIGADSRAISMSKAFVLSTVRDFWTLGSWALGNHLISLLRIQTFPWVLAWLYGPAAAGGFQAALNAINLANPVVIGLGNLIPQAVAQERSRGSAPAWKVARTYALIGFLPLALYYGLTIAFPGVVLEVLYGSGSPYLSLTAAVQILAGAWGAGYAADMVCSFLHGVDAARHAFGINAIGAATAVLTAVPLINSVGPNGGFIALAISSVVRSAAAYVSLTRMLTHDRPRYA